MSLALLYPENPKEGMFVVQISLLVVIFLSLIVRILSLMQTAKEANPHPHIAPCVNMWIVTLFFCHLLNGQCMHMPHRVERPRIVDHTTPLKCCTLCYSIVSHGTLILYYHTYMLTLQNSVISRALWLPQV